MKSAAEPIEAPDQFSRNELYGLLRVERRTVNRNDRAADCRRQRHTCAIVASVLRIAKFGLEKQAGDRQPIEGVFKAAAYEPAVIGLRSQAYAGGPAARDGEV